MSQLTECTLYYIRYVRFRKINGNIYTRYRGKYKYAYFDYKHIADLNSTKYLKVKSKKFYKIEVPLPASVIRNYTFIIYNASAKTCYFSSKRMAINCWGFVNQV